MKKQSASIVTSIYEGRKKRDSESILATIIHYEPALNRCAVEMVEDKSTALVDIDFVKKCTFQILIGKKVECRVSYDGEFRFVRSMWEPVVEPSNISTSKQIMLVRQVSDQWIKGKIVGYSEENLVGVILSFKNEKRLSFDKYVLKRSKISSQQKLIDTQIEFKVTKGLRGEERVTEIRPILN